MKKYLLTILLCTVTFFSFSQSSNWKLIDVEKTNFSNTSLKLRKAVPTNFKVYKLDTQKLKNELSFAKANEMILIELPTPDGVQRFSLKMASSLSEELTLKFPMIASYVAKGVDNTSAVARISVGTDGFHGVIFYGDKPSFYIDPYTKNNDYYIAYSRSSLPQRDQEFRCGVNTQLKRNEVIENTQKNANDGLLRTFRLALVCSGEYAEFHLNDQGVANNASDNTKKVAVLSAMNTSMTRINGVFERDLGVRMEIVGNNDQIIFLDAATDGITDGNAGTMINQVQTICDSTIGSANYDIGHIFSIGGSGLAGLGVVCINGSKARGVTGIGTPTGDPYDIDYVSHEMGHQFGANHTQNNGCNRNNSTAVEPGSASTIMGYAGICAPNVQNNSDDHFHSVSITEMWNKIQSTANCAQTTATGNSAPIISEGQDYSIPKSTPFVLKGNASDINQNDVLSYNWEQIDNQVVTMPPVSTSTSGPAFRSNPSISSPNRYMPALPTVIAGSISSTWEVVPTVAREMNFSLVVRDNVAGGANSARDDIKVTTQDITPFTVDGPSTNVDWPVGSSQTINWVVGATNQAPVNSQSINILLSTDGGISFPTTLASGTANDGTHTIVIPNNITTQARILVEAADNIFYNVNTSNFTISASDPTFIVTNTTGVVELCSNSITSATYNISVNFLNNFSETVSFSTSGEPIGSSVSFSPTTINSSGTVTMTVGDLNSVMPDSYLIDITAFSSSITRNINATLNILNATFEPLNLTSPSNSETGVSLTPVFSWDAISNASTYDIEIATDAEFNSIIVSENITTNSYTAASLSLSTTYYWRVKAKNSCGEGDFSSVSSFTTQNCTRCSSQGTTEFQTSSTRVVFNTIDNTSGKPSGYSNYTNISTTIERDASYVLSVQVNTDGPWTTGTMVWIDWNQNCDFDDAGEEYNLGATNNQNDGLTSQSPLSILIPSNASVGQTTMRVSTQYNAYPTSCLQGFDGEVEDYTLNIISPNSISWTGAVNTSWNNTLNWSTGAVPTTLDAVVIDGTFNNEPLISSSTNALVQSVTVGSGNTLTIDETSSLTVSGDFTNSGSVTLNSTADDFSSLIVTGTASGDITYNRYVNAYNDGLGGGWDFVGAPADMTIEDFITANGANIQVLGDDYAFAQYDNATGQYTRYATDTDTGSFTPAQGYAMAMSPEDLPPPPSGGTAGTTVAFTGAMETTSQSINIVNNQGNGTSGRRWNLVSNPFPSFINGNAAAGATNFLDTNITVMDDTFTGVYGWNGSDYDIYNLLDGSFSIAPGQGFWVAALSTSDAALDFTAAMRTTTGTGDFVTGPMPLTYHVALELFNGDTQKATTDFYFRDGLSLGLDPGYDAGAYNQSTKLSTRLAQGSQETAFARNAMGMDAMQNTRVPLEIRQNAGQTFRVSIADMDLPEDIYVYLEDTLNGTFTSLKEADFELVAQSNLSGVDRFFIVFKDNSELSSGDTLGINALNVYKANTDSFVTIAGITPELGQLNATIFNILGMTVREKALNPATATQTISTDGLASGLYILQLRSGNQVFIKKVIVK
jgi:hypothetical protein